jgi:hypothetical protein
MSRHSWARQVRWRRAACSSLLQPKNRTLLFIEGQPQQSQVAAQYSQVAALNQRDHLWILEYVGRTQRFSVSFSLCYYWNYGNYSFLSFLFSLRFLFLLSSLSGSSIINLQLISSSLILQFTNSYVGFICMFVKVVVFSDKRDFR